MCLLIALAAVVVLPEAALGMECVSYGCSFCGHPSNPPWHYSSCRLYRDYSSSSGGYSGGSGGGAALGEAFGAMIDGFFKGLEEAQRAEALRQQREAEQRRQAEIERRRRLEELRRERIRRAREMRLDWDRREVEISERLAGVFDPVPVGSAEPDIEGGTDFEPEVYIDSSVVDLRPEPGGQQALEQRLRMDPAFLRAQAQRAADTDAFATLNYGAVPLDALQTARTAPPFRERLKDLVKAMADDALGETLESLGPYGEAAEGARKIYTVGTDAAESILPKALDPRTYRKLASPRFHDFAEEQADLDSAALEVERSITGDESQKHETYYKKFRALLFGGTGD